MPYKNIVFIKLYLDLLDGDDRFLYQLNERQQLLYVKLLYLAGRTANQIPKRPSYVRDKIKYKAKSKAFLEDIKKIKEVYPKFIETTNYYIFTNFNDLHNRINDNKIGSSQVRPKSDQRVIPKEKKKENINKKEKENLKENNKNYKKEIKNLISNIGG